MMYIGSEELAACKAYMRVDADLTDDDAVITRLMYAADEYLTRAGAAEGECDGELRLLAVHSLTLHYYDHRDDVGNEAPIPAGLRPIINQLKSDCTGGLL